MEIAPRYKIYSALMTQSGTAAPVATILNNSLGEITWSRAGLTGVYRADSDELFTVDRTAMIIIPVGILSQFTTINWVNSSRLTILTTSDTQLFKTYVEIRVYTVINL